MKNTYLTFMLLMSICSSAISQSDYYFFQPNEQYYFVNKQNYNNEVSSRLAGIKITDEPCNELYMTVEARTIGNFPQDDYLVVPSFSGLSICQTQDSILIDVGKENLVFIDHIRDEGEPWEATIEDGIQIYGIIDSVGTVTNNEVIDSVKYINFFTSNSSRLLDGPVILSKNNGLLAGAYFWDLLNSREVILRSYSTNHAFNIDSVYSYQIGDEIHTEEVDSYYTGDSVAFLITQFRYKVVGTSQSSRRLTVDFTVDKLSYTTFDYFDRLFTVDSIYAFGLDESQTINLDSSFWLNYQPSQYTRNSGSGFFGSLGGVVHISFGCRPRKGTGYPLGFNGLYNPGEYTFDVPNGDSYITSSGGPYNMFYDQDGQSVFGLKWKYGSRPNGTTCGTPFMFKDEVTNTELIYTNTEIILFPNPSEDVLLFKKPNNIRITEFRLISSIGKLVLREQEDDLESVNLNNVPRGIYFCQIRLSNGQYRLDKISVL